MPKIIPVTREEMEKLPAEIRGNPALMAMVETIVTTYTQLEATLGYDVQLVSPEKTDSNAKDAKGEGERPAQGEGERGPDVWLEAEFWTCPTSVRNWPVVSSLTVEIRGSKLFMTTDKPELWPNIDGSIGNICCLLKRDGRWRAGPIDGMRPFQQNGGDRSVKCGAVPDGDKRKWEAVKGEKVGFCVTGLCRRGEHMRPQQRTDVGWVVWP